MLLRIAAFFILGLGCFSISSSQSFQKPITRIETRPHVLPVAIYRDIKADDLSRILVESFSENNFSLLSRKREADSGTVFQFSYAFDKSGKSDSVIFEFRVDGTVVKNRCVDCFLRWGKILDEVAIGKLPWMTQYDLSSRLYPDIDKAYAAIKSKSLNFVDRQQGFDYQNMWSGERNRRFYDNSYIGVPLPDLKRDLARAFTNAGFVLLRDSNPAADAPDSALMFSFPIDSDKPDGVVYTVELASQFDADGRCFPCESRVQYDPYQRLPAAGLTGMSSRLTLASRFESSLNRVYDQVKASTERYLRPRTQFVRPPQSAPLGSPRPVVPPVVVT